MIKINLLRTRTTWKARARMLWWEISVHPEFWANMFLLIVLGYLLMGW